MNIVTALFISIRPRQWSKNFFFFAALIFSKNLFHYAMTLKTVAGFAVLCMITGATYLFNDVIDCERDRHHPEKCNRPIAFGQLPVSIAISAMAGAVICSMGLAFRLDTEFLLVIVLYILLQIAYSTLLKNMVILDVLAITTGFVLRVLAGAVIINVAISSWLLICTFLFALFLALCKRRHELYILKDGAAMHRKVLGEYSLALLDQMISVTTASTVIAYTLYTLSEQTIEKFGTVHLVYTVPFVIYGIFRYLYLVHIRHKGGSPEALLLSDLPLIGTVLLWAITAAAIIYF